MFFKRPTWWVLLGLGFLGVKPGFFAKSQLDGMSGFTRVLTQYNVHRIK